MKLHSELTARTILWWQPRTHHDRFIHPVLDRLSTSGSLNNPTIGAATNAVGRFPELLMTEQTHSPTLDRAEFRAHGLDLTAGGDVGRAAIGVLTAWPYQDAAVVPE